MNNRHQVKLGDFSSKIKDIPCTCKGEHKDAAYQLYRTQNEHKCIVWNNCQRTLFAAWKRHLIAGPLPEPTALNEFLDFAYKTIEQEVGQDLDHFDYSYSQWYNHLTYNQQLELANVNRDNITDKPCTYDMFCKRETQMYREGESLPKARAIQGPQPEDKFVLGPVTWNLEDLFGKKFKGYCGGKNWDELESQLEQNYRDGYTIILQGDGSGFDRTQTHEVKAVDRYIYSRISKHIHHVDEEVFLRKANSRYRKIRGYIYDQGNKKKVLEAVIDGTVTSGNPDTTLMNTIRMALYIRFMAYKAGVDARFIAKGDDFAVFCKSYHDAYLIEAQIKKYWAKKDSVFNAEYGLGLVYKFVKIGDYSTFDFCSTHLLCDFPREKFKIVRQWERIIEQGAYSVKALNYTQQEVSAHVHQLVESMKTWDKDMMFYKEYRDQLLSLYPEEGKSRKIVGKTKQYLDDDGHKRRHQDELDGKPYEEIKDKLRYSSRVLDNDVVKQNFLDLYQLVPYEEPWKI